MNGEPRLWCYRCQWRHATTVEGGRRLCEDCAALARGEAPRPGRQVRRRVVDGRSQVGSGEWRCPSNDRRRGQCPRCKVGLGPDIGPDDPGWFRCLVCHVDVHPASGRVREDELALVIEGASHAR